MSIEVKISKKRVPYKAAMRYLDKRVEEVKNATNRELLWILEHPTTYTAGVSFNKKEIIDKKIKIFKSNRGGKITYHGPGQRIVYFMIDLNKRKKDIRKFINIIEISLMDFLKAYEIDCQTYRDRVGIWVTGKNGKKFNEEEKIGAIGLRLKNWVTYHGLSFNIKPDMKKYENINACGLMNFKNTCLENLGINIKENDFDDQYSKIFLKNLKNLR